MPEPRSITHILRHYRSANVTELFRTVDGVKIGEAGPIQTGWACHFGEDPGKLTVRVFMDKEHAEKFLQATAGEDAVFEDIDGELRIVAPGAGRMN